MQVSANGITIEAELHGSEDGCPLIMVRGLGTQLAHWPEALVEGFAGAGFRVVAFDNRDVGLSQRCPAPGVPAQADAILDRIRRGEPIAPAYTLDDMAADVVGLMDALGIEKAHVFGISMGGGITQLLALNHADRLLSATIVMSACRPLAARSGGDAEAAAELASSLLSRPQSRQEYLDAQVAEHAQWGSPGYPMPEDDIRAMAARAYDRGVDAEGINRQLLATSAAGGRCGALGAVTLPCLVIHGRDDALLPVELGAEIADSIPGSEFHAIDGMGHIITPALAPLIVETVRDFIARRTG